MNNRIDLSKMKKIKRSEKQRRRIPEQARLIVACATDGEDISDYAKELKEKWVKGEITMEERKKLLIEHCTKRGG